MEGIDLTGAGNHPSFELLVIGCGGGPLESNLSCYLVKSKESRWNEGCAALEGGSSLGAIATLFERTPRSFRGFGLGTDEKREFGVADGLSGGKAAGKVWEMIKTFSISHAHLDHVSGLVLSSAACTTTKTVYGLESTLANLEKVMDWMNWPNLGTREIGSIPGKAYTWREIKTEHSYEICESLSMSALPLSHGSDPRHPLSYESTAFFVRNSNTSREFLFLGDVEPDSISARPLTRKVWEVAAIKIVSNQLNLVFLECSYPNSQPTDKLFGHLKPQFVLEELRILGECVNEERGKRKLEKLVSPLEGIHVIIQHIKDDIFSPPPASFPEPLKARKAHEPLDTQSLSIAALTMSPPIATIPLRRPSLQLSYSPSLTAFPRSSPGLEFRPPATTAEEDEYDEEIDTVEETVHERIERELNEGENEIKTGVRFVIACQGMRLTF
ncbi:hypothetical protein JCM5353_000208 [Sporobolomyces roseus]